MVTKGTAAWLDEGEEFDESDSVFGQTSIGAYKLGTMIKVSDELLNDSVFDLENYISTEFARRIGAKEEEAFLVGDNHTGSAGDSRSEVVASESSCEDVLLLDILWKFYQCGSMGKHAHR